MIMLVASKPITTWAGTLLVEKKCSSLAMSIPKPIAPIIIVKPRIWIGTWTDGTLRILRRKGGKGR